MTFDEAQLYGRGLAFPPRIGPDGRVAWSEGTQNVREAIRIILQTDLEERLMLPDFGGDLRPFLFEPNIAATHSLLQESARRALARWEPRILVESISAAADPADDRGAVLRIAYRLVATGVREQVSLRLQGVNR